MSPPVMPESLHSPYVIVAAIDYVVIVAMSPSKMYDPDPWVKTEAVLEYSDSHDSASLLEVLNNDVAEFADAVVDDIFADVPEGIANQCTPVNLSENAPLV